MREYRVQIKEGKVVSSSFKCELEEGKLTFSDVFKPVNYIVIGEKLNYTPSIKFSKGNAILTLPKVDSMEIVIGGY